MPDINDLINELDLSIRNGNDTSLREVIANLRQKAYELQDEANRANDLLQKSEDRYEELSASYSAAVDDHQREFTQWTSDVDAAAKDMVSEAKDLSRLGSDTEALAYLMTAVNDIGNVIDSSREVVRVNTDPMILRDLGVTA